MTAHSKTDGHDIYLDKDKVWRYTSSNEIVESKHVLMTCSLCKKRRAQVKLCKRRPYSGRGMVAVDNCISGLVQLLNNHGVHTLNSCCGHGTQPGEIWIEQDGKEIILKLNKKVK